MKIKILWIVLVWVLLLGTAFLLIKTAEGTIVYASTSPIVESLTPEEQVIAFFSKTPVMVKIARVESTFDPKAMNPKSTAKGLFQILDGTWKDNKCQGDVLDSTDNINCAQILYEKYGTEPWKASKDKWSML